MGNSCYSCQNLCSTDTSIRRVALKLPHGPKGVVWNNNRKQFEREDINQWLTQLYSQSSWTGWFCYNDESPLSAHTAKGHCKGVLTWNTNRIGWLLHSVPRFPREFSGASLSPIDASELVYGQSFLYVEQPITAVQLEDIVRQILWMKPNLFHVHNMPPVTPYNSSPVEIKTLRWSKKMTHLAKLPEHATDFIGTELCKLNNETWHEETWKRGSEYAPTHHIVPIVQLCVDGITFTSSQDHSKWATSPPHIWIGDLNHMKSQEKRGGGGMVIEDAELANAFRSVVKT